MTKKKKQGRWMEEYLHCSHSYVAVRRRDLPGYCSKCGNGRKLLYHLPSATDVGELKGDDEEFGNMIEEYGIVNPHFAKRIQDRKSRQ